MAAIGRAGATDVDSATQATVPAASHASSTKMDTNSRVIRVTTLRFELWGIERVVAVAAGENFRNKESQQSRCGTRPGLAKEPAGDGT